MGKKQQGDVRSPAQQAADSLSDFGASIHSSWLDLPCSHLSKIQHLSPKVDGNTKMAANCSIKRLQQLASRRRCTSSHNRPFVTLTEEEAVLAVLRLAVTHIAYYLPVLRLCPPPAPPLTSTINRVSILCVSVDWFFY